MFPLQVFLLQVFPLHAQNAETKPAEPGKAGEAQDYHVEVDGKQPTAAATPPAGLASCAQSKKLPAPGAASAACTGDGFKVVSSVLEVRGRVPNIDEAAFVKAAEAAKDGCPISQALKGNVDLSVAAAVLQLERVSRPSIAQRLSGPWVQIQLPQ